MHQTAKQDLAKHKWGYPQNLYSFFKNMVH